MTERNPAKAFGLLALVAAVLVGCWFVFFSGGTRSADPEPGAMGVEGPEAGGEIAPPDQGEDAKAGAAEPAKAEGEQRPTVRERTSASTTVTGTIEGGRTALSGATVALRPAPRKQPSFASLLSFTNPQQFQQLEHVFKKMEPLQTRAVGEALFGEVQRQRESSGELMTEAASAARHALLGAVHVQG